MLVNYPQRFFLLEGRNCPQAMWNIHIIDFLLNWKLYFNFPSIKKQCNIEIMFSLYCTPPRKQFKAQASNEKWLVDVFLQVFSQPNKCVFIHNTLNTIRGPNLKTQSQCLMTHDFIFRFIAKLQWYRFYFFLTEF